MPIIHVQNHSISLFVQNHSISLFAATIFPWSSALNLSAYLPDTTYHNLWSFFLLGILLLLLLLNHPIRLLSLPWEHSSGPIHLLFSYKYTSYAPTVLGPSADSTSTYNRMTRPLITLSSLDSLSSWCNQLTWLTLSSLTTPKIRSGSYKRSKVSVSCWLLLINRLPATPILRSSKNTYLCKP